MANDPTAPGNQPEPLVVRLIAYGSVHYHATLELRERILRQPLGLTLSATDTAGEEDQLHLAVFSGEACIGCLVLRTATSPDDSPALQMRQVAVAENWRNRGIGRQLVETAETCARAAGVGHIVLHARETAIPFYLKLGYTPEEDAFLEVGIPHRAMRKSISV